MQRREPVVPQLTVAELGAACYRGAYNAGVELVIQGTRAALDTQAAARLSPDLAKRLLKGAACRRGWGWTAAGLVRHCGAVVLLPTRRLHLGAARLLQTCGSLRCARGA